MAKSVAEIMTAMPVVGNLSTTFTQVLRLFTEYGVHHLPIVDADNKLIGIVSSNDLYKVFMELSKREPKISLDNASIDAAITIGEIMTPNPVVITPQTGIEEAAKLIVQKKFLSLPVVSNNALVGILSAKDLLKYYAE